MADESLDDETLVEHTRRQTRALETLVNLAWGWTFVAILGAVLLLIAYLGN